MYQTFTVLDGILSEDGHVVCKIMAHKCVISGGTLTPNARIFRSITLKRSMPSPGIEGPANQQSIDSLKTSLLAYGNTQHLAKALKR